jgi:hypothetical protein
MRTVFVAVCLAMLTVLALPACGGGNVVLEYPAPAARSVSEAWLPCAGGAEPHCAEAFRRMQETRLSAPAHEAIAHAVDEAVRSGSDDALSSVSYDAAIVALGLGDRAAAGRFLDSALKHGLDPALARRLGGAEPEGLRPARGPLPDQSELLAKIESVHGSAGPAPSSPVSSSPAPVVAPPPAPKTVTVGGFTFPLKCTSPMRLEGLTLQMEDVYRIIVVSEGCDLTIENSTITHVIHPGSQYTDAATIGVASRGKLRILRSTLHFVGAGMSLDVSREADVTIEGSTVDVVEGNDVNHGMFKQGHLRAKDLKATSVKAGPLDVSIEQSTVGYMQCDFEARVALTKVTATRIGSNCTLTVADSTFNAPKDVQALTVAAGTAKVTGSTFTCPRECINVVGGSLELRGSHASGKQMADVYEGRAVMVDSSCDGMETCIEVRDGATVEASGMKITGDQGVESRAKGHLTLTKSSVDVKNVAVSVHDNGQADVAECTLQGRYAVKASDGGAVRIKRGSATGSEFGMWAGYKSTIDAEGVKVTGQVRAGPDSPINVH